MGNLCGNKTIEINQGQERGEKVEKSISHLSSKKESISKESMVE